MKLSELCSTKVVAIILAVDRYLMSLPQKQHRRRRPPPYFNRKTIISRSFMTMIAFLNINQITNRS